MIELIHVSKLRRKIKLYRMFKVCKLFHVMQEKEFKYALTVYTDSFLNYKRLVPARRGHELGEGTLGLCVWDISRCLTKPTVTSLH